MRSSLPHYSAAHSLPCTRCEGCSWPPAATPFLGGGWGTRLAFGSGRFLMGPAGLEARQPSRSSTPPLGAWPYLWGASPPTYRCTKASSVDVFWWVSGVSEIRPAGLGLTGALEAGVGRDLCVTFVALGLMLTMCCSSGSFHMLIRRRCGSCLCKLVKRRRLHNRGWSHLCQPMAA